MNVTLYHRAGELSIVLSSAEYDILCHAMRLLAFASYGSEDDPEKINRINEVNEKLKQITIA